MERTLRGVTVVGIGADGWAGLSDRAQAAVAAAEVLLGSTRQLALIPDDGQPRTRIPWPSPLLPALPGLLEENQGRRVCVLASGDPMFYGIGTALVRAVGPRRLEVIPHPSSAALACSRLGWPTEDVEVVSAVGRPLSALRRAVLPGRRILVLSEDAGTPAAVAELLRGCGYGPSRMTVLEELGAASERRVEGSAARWSHPLGCPLNIVAVECEPEPHVPVLPLVPGLPETAFEHDGQITKREVRAITLARLAPVPGALLWDVGAGSGSVAIEWLRTHAACRAVAVESRADRARAIEHNADRLGVPQLRTVLGRAPEALLELERPDAIFVGGGASDRAVLRACWDALGPGGRMVVNAVTLRAEVLVAEWQARLGGDLVRVSVQRSGPVGDGSSGHAVWRPALPITQWTVEKR